MSRLPLFLCFVLMASLPLSASAETREEYLERLRDVCSAECMQPREFLRTARRRAGRDQGDMAIIMDVAYVSRDGSKIALHSLNLEGSQFDDIINLGSAGIDTSQRSGISGVSRDRSNGSNPNLIIVEIDERILADLLTIRAPNSGAPAAALTGSQADPLTDGEIVVEEERGREVARPTLISVRSLFRGRRIVVRGVPRFEQVLVGARRDFRRKQVTLEVSNAGDLVMLPGYDDEGEPILDGPEAGLSAVSR